MPGKYHLTVMFFYLFYFLRNGIYGVVQAQASLQLLGLSSPFTSVTLVAGSIVLGHLYLSLYLLWRVFMCLSSFLRGHTVYAYRVQKTTFGSQFSSSTFMWPPGLDSKHLYLSNNLEGLFFVTAWAVCLFVFRQGLTIYPRLA